MNAHRIKRFRPRNKKYSHRQKKIKRDEHHVYPSSRKIVEDLGKFKPLLQSLVLKKEIYIHNLCWHRLFSNLFAEEAVSIIKNACSEKKYIAPQIIPFIKQHIYHEQNISTVKKEELNAWQKLFGNHYNYRKIRRIIFRDWTYPGIKTVVKNKKVIRVTIFFEKIPSKALNKIFENIKKCRDIQIMPLKNNRLWKIF